jgi:hypothetical protein
VLVDPVATLRIELIFFLHRTVRAPPCRNTVEFSIGISLDPMALRFAFFEIRKNTLFDVKCSKEL